jgi:hypothetical protein
MSDDLRKIARERALSLVGEGVWNKLSRKCQLGAIEEELRMMGAKPGTNALQRNHRVVSFIEEFKRLAASEQAAVYLEIEQVWKGSMSSDARCPVC